MDITEDITTPCNDCSHEHACGARLLCCTVFVAYCIHGIYDADAARHPSRTLYRRFYPDDDRPVHTRGIRPKPAHHRIWWEKTWL